MRRGNERREREGTEKSEKAEGEWVFPCIHVCGCLVRTVLPFLARKNSRKPRNFAKSRCVVVRSGSNLVCQKRCLVEDRFSLLSYLGCIRRISDPRRNLPFGMDGFCQVPKASGGSKRPDCRTFRRPLSILSGVDPTSNCLHLAGDRSRASISIS